MLIYTGWEAKVAALGSLGPPRSVGIQVGVGHRRAGVGHLLRLQ